MQFTLTRYIYPLQDKFTLSSELRYYLDNPRTELEINELKKYLYEHIGEDINFSEESELTDLTGKLDKSLSLNIIISKITEYFPEHDEYALQVRKSASTITPHDFLAKYWCIIRITKTAEEDFWFSKDKKTNDDDRDFYLHYRSNKRMIEYCHLLSFLIQYDEDHIGDTFLLNNENNAIALNDFNLIRKTVLINSLRHTKKSEIFKHVIFPEIREKLIIVVNQIDDAIQREFKEHILYIGGVIHLLDETEDVRLSILLLVSLIELLLARNPDHSRYNIEDSINKQFQLKAALAIHKNDPSTKPYAIKKTAQNYL